MKHLSFQKWSNALGILQNDIYALFSKVSRYVFKGNDRSPFKGFFCRESHMRKHGCVGRIEKRMIRRNRRLHFENVYSGTRKAAILQCVRKGLVVHDWSSCRVYQYGCRLHRIYQFLACELYSFFVERNMNGYYVALAEYIGKALVDYAHVFCLIPLAAAVGYYVHAESFCQCRRLHSYCAGSHYAKGLAFKLSADMAGAGTAGPGYFVAHRKMPVYRYHKPNGQFCDRRSRIARAIAYGNSFFAASVKIHMVHSGEGYRNEF